MMNDNEFARYLASYLKQNQDEFLDEHGNVDSEELYWVIRDFQKELP